MQTIVVREHARLTTGRSACAGSLDAAVVPDSAFEWLCKESARLRAAGAPLVRLDDRQWLRLDNYVGVIETPCGTRIEILPKAFDGTDDSVKSRTLLRRMLSRCMDITPRESGPASIQAFDGPLTEWVMGQFLDTLDSVVKRGLRFDYRTVRDQQPYLRGRLEVARQIRQPAGRQHLFQIEHDVFDADRPENRLLRSALTRVCRATRNAENWRLAHELAARLADVPPSADVDSDFRRWRDDRLLAHYRAVRPWCALILNQNTPLALTGSWHGRSLLFPMERLFERYVEVCLRQRLPSGARLNGPRASQYLCTHQSERWFQLRPDFVVEIGSRRLILDTKWKLLDDSRSAGSGSYGLHQGDFYQLFAYGQHYLDDLAGCRTMFLVYPRTTNLTAPLPAFRYRNDMVLWVVPFDLDEGVVMGEQFQFALEDRVAV